MSSLCFFQMCGILRSGSRASGFVGRCCSHPTQSSFSRHRKIVKCMNTSRASASDSRGTEEEDSVKKAESLPTFSEKDQDALFDAFDSYIDDIETDSKSSLSPAEHRKQLQEKQKQKARDAYLKRLEILSALPHELVVEHAPDRCPGCGCVLQTHSPTAPGFLPPMSGKGEVTALSTAADGEVQNFEQLPKPKAEREAVCQRCYRLSYYGKMEPHLRVTTARSSKARSQAQALSSDRPPETSQSYELSPTKFRKCLERLRTTKAVIIYLVDIFDFHGTFINSLQDIIGKRNPIVLAVNKTDLLPANYKPARVEAWIAQECKGMGLQEVNSIHLISSIKGTGVKIVLAEAFRLAKQRRTDIFVIGTANVGKSSFINQLIKLRKRNQNLKPSRGPEKSTSGTDAFKSSGAITTSVVPGTTLDMIRISLGGNVHLVDTPGLMVSHQLTNYLDEKELRAVLPSRNVTHVTFRLGEGKALHIGALARLEVVSGKPFFFTCFFAPAIKVHPGKLDGAEDFLHRHVGGILTPPYCGERLSQLGEWTSKSFTAEGVGWKKASVDIVFSGLGWISVTGPGAVRLRICVPEGVGVFTREPLMPFEVQTGVSTYTGSSAVNRKRAGKLKRQHNRRTEMTF